MTFDELKRADYRFPTVALFYGAACAPCERLKPKLREVCADLGVRLETFNSVQEMDAIRALGLRTVPAVFVVHHGVVTPAFAGDYAKADIKVFLADAGVA